jgi:4,5-DOPA dioxygenase extradiol
MATTKLPVIFVGHGSPLSVLPDNIYGRAWRTLGQELTKPRAILMISAHWNIAETAVSDILQPQQIYDFYGFPEELYTLKYNPPGSPELAEQVIKILAPILEVKINHEWGIDHGAWVPLRSFFPLADVPVVQLSLDYSQSAAVHYQIGQALRLLREQGVLIIGSGDMVHNLGLVKDDEQAEPYPWAKDFEAKILSAIATREHKSLIDYHHLGPEAKLAIPTPEHYLPLLYILALQDESDKIKYFVQGLAHGSVSMTSFICS